MTASNNYVVGLYDDEDVLLEAVQKVRKSGVHIEEVYTPFPVHGLDEVLGYKRTRLPVAAFLFGLLGTILAFTMMIGMYTIDWKMNIGGKDFLPLPDFIPIAFELTVLISALGMVNVFFVVSNLKPWGIPRIFDLRTTDNLHLIALNLDANTIPVEELRKVLKETGAVEVNDKTFE
ncbi:DUF3341 domain-containing protein [Nafulsella turpanensis]|uniref:DUF3341 domain-containing protein n=1 Tax=Nafulsella turpanensis TaxID=1265690 RepID=UPI00034A2F6D|nr:DUF3341 domain-containing protein [Nafulsella turpanensis]